MKKLLAGVAGLAAIGFAGSALADSVVNVQIDVLPTVSMWANDDTITLTMNGANAENSAVAESSLSIINNVDARVEATVTGSLPEEINFFIFNGLTAADATNAMVANSNNPAGAAKWTDANLGPAPQTIIPNTGVNQNIATQPVVYASNAPNELPLPNAYNLAVTYSIIAN